MTSSPPADRAGLILHLLHRASQSADDMLANRLSETSLTPRQLTVIRAIADAPDASQTALVDATGIDRSTIADIVRRLVDAGLVERKRLASDARMYSLRLTQAGADALEHARPIADDVASAILATVDDIDKTALMRALASISETLGPVASARVSARAKSLLLRPSADGTPSSE